MQPSGGCFCMTWNVVRAAERHLVGGVAKERVDSGFVREKALEERQRVGR